MRTQSPDTPAEVEAVVVERLRAMTPAARLRAALDANRMVTRLALAGIRMRHGDLDEREMRLRLLALRLDREAMVRAFGWDPEREGY
jgi:hypothetical protein